MRALPVGAEIQHDGAVHFRVWAPRPADIALIVQGREGRREIALERDEAGYAAARVSGVVAGDRYCYRIGDEDVADPASRYQPDGPFGLSQLVDPAAFTWSDTGWRGSDIAGQVIYEMHIGTFTPHGTWQGAMEQLPRVARAGITMLEVMPVSEFPGRFGWGYDGVFPYAPTRLYGPPDAFKAFVNRAHDLGLAVILDVVYNHLGPDGCVFSRYSQDYFSKRYENEWGEALNFDGPASAHVREYFSCNAAYWISEYHLDGLRLDATQTIYDSSPDHIVAEIARRARSAAPHRAVVIVSENEPQEVRMVRPAAEGGYGLDGLWNDDFHHSAVAALTGRREAYYSDHRGTPQELISAGKRGYLFQGQRYGWQKQNRGSRTDGVAPAAFINFIENHDQLANSGNGDRLHSRTSPGRYRAMCALYLLLPGTPMLFQGQEFGATSPFLYFADHRAELAESVASGRASFVSQFPSLGSPSAQARLALPHDRATFARCILRWDEYDANVAHRRLFEDLLALRRSEHALHAQRPGALDGAVLDNEAFVLRFSAEEPLDERVLFVNLGPDIVASSFAEPLVAPPDGCSWSLRWSSEHPDYGGGGAADVIDDTGWRLPGHAAVLLNPIAL